MVTQCPIVQNDLYLDPFSVHKEAGTFWYHNHYSTQTRSVNSIHFHTAMRNLNLFRDGLRWPLIIYDIENSIWRWWRYCTIIVASWVTSVKSFTETTVIALADSFQNYLWLTPNSLVDDRYSMAAPILSHILACMYVHHLSTIPVGAYDRPCGRQHRARSKISPTLYRTLTIPTLSSPSTNTIWQSLKRTVRR